MNKLSKNALLRGGAAMQALALLGAGVVTLGVMSAPAAAQDYTSGALGGTVTDDAGRTVAGATVTITSNNLGITRTQTTSSSGGYRFTGLPAGSYNVSVNSDGAEAYRAEGVIVAASQTATINIALASGGDVIVVTGAKAQADFTGTNTGLTVNLADFTKTRPIGRDLTSVILLAPGTSQGDDGFSSNGSPLASLGGASVAENAYYVNGLNTTNFDNYLGSSRIPFEFYQSVEVKTGGYSAEYGRATGGIVNAVSKSGTNEFVGAIHLNWEPNFLRSDAKNLLNCDDTGCERKTNRAFDRTMNYSAIVEAGGPIIEDRLFFYGLAEFRKQETLRNDSATGLGTERVQNDPFYAFKIDAFPIDGQHLEFTLFDNRNTERRTDYAYSETGGTAALGAAQSTVNNKSGGVNFVGKYTGTFTDWLTVSGAYGRVRDRFDSQGIDEGSSTYYFSNSSGTTINGVANGGLFTGQPLTSRDSPYSTEREFYRGDIDLFFNILGDHHVRAGFDVENNTLEHVSVRNGAADLLAAGWITQEAIDANFGGAGAALYLRDGDIVEVNYFNGGGGFKAQNKAFYVQDEWKVTDRLTLNLGLRRDDFGLEKPGGNPYISLKKNYAPRLGASYDLWEGKTGKVYGSYSQYYLPVASNTAFRQASPELYIRERFNYDGFGPDGLPNIISQVTNNPSYQAACPFGLTPFSSGLNCNVTGDGTVKPTDASLSSSLKATKQSEWIIGYKHQLNDWTFGLSYTHRSLDVSAEDVAVDAAVLAYCDQNGLTGCDETWTGFHQYVILNPGSDATFALAGQDGRTVTISAEDLRYPKAKRTYDAVEFTFDRAWDGKWSLGGSYTWSKAKGNSEGFVQSDFEQDDSGITQDFDQPGFTQGAYGYVPNDRRHRFKIFGAVALSENFTIGTTIRVDSPRSLSCFGYNPNPNYFDPDGDPYSDFGNAYGAASHYCASGTTALDGDGVEYYPISSSQISPRGQGLKTAWIKTIDISARYNVKFGDRDVVFRADVFNLLNSQGNSGRNEIGDLDLHYPTVDDPATSIDETTIADGVTGNPNYGIISSYQSPRYVRLGVDISF